MAEEREDIEITEGKGGKKKLIIIIVVALLLIGGGVAAFFMMSGGDRRGSPVGHFILIDDLFTNPNSQETPRWSTRSSLMCS